MTCSFPQRHLGLGGQQQGGYLYERKRVAASAPPISGSMPIFAPLSSGGDDRQVSRTSSERPSKRPRTAKSPTDTGSTAVLNTSVPQQPARLAIPHAPPTRPLPAQQQPKSKSRTKKAPKSTAGAAAAPSKPALPPPEPPVKKTDEELMAEEVHWEVDYIVAKRGSVLKGNRQWVLPASLPLLILPTRGPPA